MGYRIEAVIAAEHVLRVLAKHAHIVPLGQNLSLLLMTDEFHDSVVVADATRVNAFWKLPAGFDRPLAACSTHGTVAYVEADYTGGVGCQAAQVWADGRVVLGPLRVGIGEPHPADGSPISQALRALGVIAGRRQDEFDAVGLSRHRDPLDWLDV
ncbi:MAG TPA: hypothetical protein VM677_05740 [Actinokineospora sp.]|nr:hypothetical protein [Actinokineospora sp.]